jgi:hypothetical protein
MKNGFPQFATSAKQGDLGISLVSRIVTDNFGWLFKRNHQEHDFGIDGQIEVVRDDGAITGQMLACQVKCGASFFRETNRWGYIYRGELKHFNYLANYPIPVIIVICEPDSRELYWAHFRADETEPTGAGWKLTIPYDNKFSSSKSALQSLLPASTDYFSILQPYWALNNMLMESSGVLFVLDCQDVRAMDISRAENFFHRLCATKELAYECQGKIEIGFFGYDDEPRELWEIEEVRRYVALLDEAFPELFFFVRTEISTATLSLFVFCLMPVSWESERSTPEISRRVIVDLEAMPAFLERHFLGLNLISEWLGLPAEEIRRISEAVGKLLGYTPKPTTTKQSST